MEAERSRGGQFMAKKVWRSFYFIVEVAIESPGIIEEEEATEDAAEFMSGVGGVAGRVHSSYASIVRVDEVGFKRPPECPVIIRESPSGTKVELELPRGIEKKEQYQPILKKSKKVTKKAKKEIKKKTVKRR